MKFLFVLFFLVQPLAAQTFSVIHEKRLWKDGHGTIEITDEGIRYASDKAKDTRSWTYRDIQHLDRISVKEFTILSYEDEARYLGRDRSYRFLITEGEFTEELFQKVSEKMDRPVTNRILPDNIAVQYQVPVKHTHTFGGCEGVLKFTENFIYYETDHPKDTREWMFERDVQSVWSSNPYELEIHVYENNRREFSKTRIYTFQIKEPLDQDMYRKLKLRLYELD